MKQKAVHPINSVCPYFTMYPLDFPLRVLANETKKNRWVYDPFCGRGTTNLAARLNGMPSVGVDSSPVAVAIARAKLVQSSVKSVVDCATQILREGKDPERIPNGQFWKRAYNATVLHQICQLREEFLRDCNSSRRKLLRAIILGGLHGPLTKTQPSYFSNQCPRTFAPKPAYALRYWKRHKMSPPAVDVLAVIQRRAERFLSIPLPETDGVVLERDSRKWGDEDFEGLFSWVITSPPYYGMRTYIPDQWLRYWFVGGPSIVDYSSKPKDFQHSSPEDFSKQLNSVWLKAALMSRENAKLVCRFGGIHDRRQDCLEILKDSFRDSGWKLTTIKDAGTALDGRRQAAQFGAGQKKRPRKEYDVYARRAA
jgi:DNA methylase